MSTRQPNPRTGPCVCSVAYAAIAASASSPVGTCKSTPLVRNAPRNGWMCPSTNPRQHQIALEVDDAGVRTFERSRTGVVSDVGDRIAGDGHCLRPRLRGRHGVDPSVPEDDVGVRRRRRRHRRTLHCPPGQNTGIQRAEVRRPLTCRTDDVPPETALSACAPCVARPSSWPVRASDPWASRPDPPESPARPASTPASPSA